MLKSTKLGTTVAFKATQETCKVASDLELCRAPFLKHKRSSTHKEQTRSADSTEVHY